LEGFGFNEKFENLHAKVQYGAGIEYGLSKCRVKLYGEHNLNFSDNIDYIKEECEMIIIIVSDWV
jgi:curli production assembly/transport component CsgG